MRPMSGPDSLKARRTLSAGGQTWEYFSIDAAEHAGIGPVSRLPFSLKVVLENLLRHEDGRTVTVEDIRGLGAWLESRRSDREIAFHPARVMMPDSSGIPLLADLAAMRDATARLGGDPDRINPLTPVDVIVDHSLMVDVAGRPEAAARNLKQEFERNGERYAFLRWGEQAFDNLRVVPPATGICHQINLEYLSRVVWTDASCDPMLAFPDTVLGMDSHTPMINGLGVVGWGVGGLEAGAVMLGEPVSMRIPEVVGCRLSGRLAEAVTTTDLVLTVTQALRTKGVVAKFVEFFGPGVDDLPLPERATLANMAPEYGATIGMFPIDGETIRYLKLTGRAPEHVALVEAYAKAQGLWRDSNVTRPDYTEVVEVDLGAVVPSVAGPRRPQDRIHLSAVPGTFAESFADTAASETPETPVAGSDYRLTHGDVVIAAITSCANTSNPSVMIAAGMLARNAVARGLAAKPWVKTSLAPGSRVVADYLASAGLQDPLDALGFHLVGFGCTTCMGNSGPLAEPIARAIEEAGLVVSAVLSGNRNFEGRIHSLVQANFLASPPMVVAYALAGSVRIDLMNDPLGQDAEGKPVYLRDLWPSDREIQDAIERTLSPALYRRRYARVFDGGDEWQGIAGGSAATFAWEEGSTYIRRPPHFDDMTAEPAPVSDILDARPLAILGDTVTTDHISPVGAIPEDGPAGRYLKALQVRPSGFNSFASRRVNHQVMVRGTFANIRLRNEMVPGTEGGYTRHMPDGSVMEIYDAAMRYRSEGVPLVVIAGNEYGTGSSRDWAAKGTRLLGIRAVIAEGFERIHRANLIGTGVLPVQFAAAVNRRSLALDGSERFTITGLETGIRPGMEVSCRITRADGRSETMALLCRLDTFSEVAYYRHGGILHYVLRGMLEQVA